MKEIKITELCKLSGIARRTLDTIIREFNIEKLYSGQKNEAYIETKYIPNIILYIYCTKNIGQVINNQLDITQRSHFTEVMKNKNNSEALKTIEEHITNNFYTFKELKSAIESNDINIQIDMLKKLNNYSNGIYDERVIIVDTSALHKRPAILEDLINNFRRVIIPKVVFEELENQKDRRVCNSKDSELKKRANLILSSITNMRSSLILSDSSSNSNVKNDEKIFEVALNEKSSNVYILSEDKGFKIRCLNTQIEAITLEEYESLFLSEESKTKVSETLVFLNKVKNRDYEWIKTQKLDNFNLNYYSSNGLTPLITAIRNRDLNTVNLLASNKKVDLNKRDQHKYKITPLAHAVQVKNISIIKILISNGADVNLGGQGVNYNNTPLMIASWNGDIKSVNELLKSKDICINQVDSNGFTPLIKAAIRNRKYVIKTLLKHNADTKIRSFTNKTALDFAIENSKLYKNSNNNAQKYNDALEIINLLRGER